MKITTVAILMASSMLTACTMAPHYDRPKVDVSNQWSNSLDIGTAEQDAVANIEWRQFFKSPEIQSIIELALEHNKNLAIAAANIEEARAMYRIQRADLIPNINVNAEGLKQRMPDALSTTGVSVNSETYKANLASTSYELDLFGRLRSLNKAAAEDYLATLQAKKSPQISLIAEIENAYLQLLADKEILRLTQNILKAQSDTYSLMLESFNTGAASKLDVAQVKQTLEAAKVNLSIYERLVGQDKNALTLLIGTSNARNIMDNEFSLKDVNLMKHLPVTMPSQVLLTRPNVMQAEHDLKALNANIGAVRAAFFPKISLTGNFGFASTDLSTLFTGSASNAWAFMPSVSLPIFEGGRNIANLGISNTRKKSGSSFLRKGCANSL
jgi:multidrug efflux system outer membrane protein